MEAETCGESRKVVKSVLIFIYALVISLSLASKFSKPDTQRIELPYSLSLSPLSLLPFSVPYLPHILFRFHSQRGHKRVSRDANLKLYSIVLWGTQTDLQLIVETREPSVQLMRVNLVVRKEGIREIYGDTDSEFLASRW